MASYSVNPVAVNKARSLIDARQYVLGSTWGDLQPSADDENAYLDNHSWDDYAAWHLGLTGGANHETKPATPSPTATSAASIAWA